MNLINQRGFQVKKIIIFLFISTISFSSQAVIIHDYDFETGVTDLVGSEDGVLFSGASVNGGMLLVDGVDDYVEFASYLIPTGDFSVAFNARQDSAQANYAHVLSQDGARFYIGPANSANSNVIRIGDQWINTGIIYPSDGEFHHFVVTADTSIPETKLYIDGVLQATFASAVSVSGTGTPTRLGRQFGGIGEYFHGAIDDLKIYNHALTQTSIDFLAFGPPTPVPMFNSKFLLILFAFVGLIGLYRIRLNS